MTGGCSSSADGVGRRKEDAPARQQAGRTSAELGAQPKECCSAWEWESSGTFSWSWPGQDAVGKVGEE